MNLAGNCMNHPERIQPDRHRAGSPLPRANLHNSIGYLPDGTPLNAAGNAINHPERMKPDKHVSGSPLPKSVYCTDMGYLADGTYMRTAGNNSMKARMGWFCRNGVSFFGLHLGLFRRKWFGDVWRFQT